MFATELQTPMVFQESLRHRLLAVSALRGDRLGKAALVVRKTLVCVEPVIANGLPAATAGKVVRVPSMTQRLDIGAQNRMSALLADVLWHDHPVRPSSPLISWTRVGVLAPRRNPEATLGRAA
jgi:hypothetical protein